MSSGGDNLGVSYNISCPAIRAEQYSNVGDYTKCFFNTETVLSLHQHYASGCIVSVSPGLCGVHYVDVNIGHNQHYRKVEHLSSLKKLVLCKNFGFFPYFYRKDCYGPLPCPLAERVVEDARVWTHLDTVITNSKNALKAIYFD